MPRYKHSMEMRWNEIESEKLLSQQQRREADVFAMYRRYSGRDPVSAGRQEELLRDARSYVKAHVTAATENINLGRYKAGLTLKVWEQFLPRHKYFADCTLTFPEFDAALWNEGSPALIELLPTDAPNTVSKAGSLMEALSNIESALDNGKRKEAVAFWQDFRERNGLPFKKVDLYNFAGQDKSEYYKWERGDLRNESQAHIDIRQVLLDPSRLTS